MASEKMAAPTIGWLSVHTIDSWLWFFQRPLIIPSLGLLQNNSYVMGIFKVSNDARKVIHFKYALENRGIYGNHSQGHT